MIDNPNYKGSYTSMADVLRSCLAKTNGITANTEPAGDDISGIATQAEVDAFEAAEPAPIPTSETTVMTNGELYAEVIAGSQDVTLACFKENGQYLISERLYTSVSAAIDAAKTFLKSDEGSIDPAFALALLVPIAYFVRAMRNAFGK